MFKQCVAFAAVLAVAVAKPSLGYTYPAASYVAAPVATTYSAYSAPAVYPAAHSVYSPSVYSPSVYSAPYPVVAKAYAPVATAAVAPATTYAAAPVASYVPTYSGYPGYTAPLAYSNGIATPFLVKKK